jgi:hypothetical protein
MKDGDEGKEKTKKQQKKMEKETKQKTEMWRREEKENGKVWC